MIQTNDDTYRMDVSIEVGGEPIVDEMSITLRCVWQEPEMEVRVRAKGANMVEALEAVRMDYLRIRVLDELRARGGIEWGEIGRIVADALIAGGEEHAAMAQRIIGPR